MYTCQAPSRTDAATARHSRSSHPDSAPPLRSAMKKREPTPEEDFEMEPDEQEMARIIEERRRRRAAILLKHTGTESTDRSTAAGTPAPGAALSTAGSTAGSMRDSAGASQSGAQLGSSTSDDTPTEPRARTRSVSPVERAPEQGDFALAKAEGTMTPPQADADNNISAADYNPDLDRLEDEERARQRAQKGQPQGAAELAAGTGEAKERVEGDESEWEEVEVEEDDEVEDMFALGSDDDDAPKKKKTIRVRKGAARPGAVSLLRCLARLSAYGPPTAQCGRRRARDADRQLGRRRRLLPGDARRAPRRQGPVPRLCEPGPRHVQLRRQGARGGARRARRASARARSGH